jgi:hypothetical protein
VAMYLSETSAPNCQFKRRHTMMTWCLTERWTQTGHTTRCLDTEDHNKHFHSIKKIIYLLSPWSRIFLLKLTSLQLVKKFAAFYGTRSLITTFTSTRHLSLSWASSIESITPHPTSRTSILILFSHLRLGLPGDPFSSDFPTNTLYTRYMPYPSNSSRFYHAKNIGWGIQIIKPIIL